VLYITLLILLEILLGRILTSALVLIILSHLIIPYRPLRTNLIFRAYIIYFWANNERISILFSSSRITFLGPNKWARTLASLIILSIIYAIVVSLVDYFTYPIILVIIVFPISIIVR